jgi:hypothetical protein
MPKTRNGRDKLILPTMTLHASQPEQLIADINALREREPDPFTAEPGEVVTHVREAGELLEQAERMGHELLTDGQWRYLNDAAMRAVRFAHSRLEHDRHNAQHILRRLFRLGTVPAPDGSYQGELVAVSTGLLSDPFFEWMTRIYLPWQGKNFVAATQSGDNIFLDNAWSKATGRLGWPSYRVSNDTPPGTVRVFRFKSSVSLDIEEEEVSVLRLDYSDPANPLPVRRIVDEIVSLPGGYILGKAYMRGVRDLRRVCYFGLFQA